jgi:outer membrane protease
MKKIFICILFLAVSFRAAALQADSGAELFEEENFGFSFAPMYTFLNGQSDEMVLQINGYPGKYLSKLTWDLDAIHMAGGKISFNFCDKLFLNSAFSTALSEDSGEMYDYDWLYQDYASQNPDLTTWTNKSVSDITLVSSYLFDFNLSYKIYGDRANDVFGLAGYKVIFWSWTDSLTEIEYPYEDSDYDSLIGTNGIDYKADYRVPYFGFGYAWGPKKVKVGLSFIYSPIVNAETVDHHKYVGSSEEKYFRDHFSIGNYLGLSIYARVPVWEKISVSLAYDWEKIFKTQGDTTTVTENGSSKTYSYSDDSVSMSYSASSFTCALEYNY